MGRHTGGQKNFQYQRATCPNCGRSISGGRLVEMAGYWIRLRKHNRKRAHHGRGLVTEPCPGSRKAVLFR